MSAEHPTNPRVLKERERDRGLRQSRDITIETYTNQRWKRELSEPRQQEMNWVAAVQHVNSPSAGSSREITPRSGDDGQAGASASNFPQEIGYFSGNPIVEVTKGLIHLYKKKWVNSALSYKIFHSPLFLYASANARPSRKLHLTNSACWPCQPLLTATIC